MSLETLLISNFIRHEKNNNKLFFNKNKSFQSGVAIIFRQEGPFFISNELDQFSLQKTQSIKKLPPKFIEKEKLNLSILFIQRQHNSKDVHSGQIAFPGGKCENQESDFDAAIRETREETGIDLKNDQMRTFYIGSSNENIYVRKSRSKSLYCSYHCFLVIDREGLTNKFERSVDEVAKIEWIKISKFYINPQSYLYKDESTVTFSSTIFKNRLFENVKKNYEYSMYPKVNIGMDNDLYGLTLYIFGNVLNKMTDGLQVENEQVKTIKELIGVFRTAQIKFNYHPKLQTGLNQIFKLIFTKYRVNILDQGIPKNNHIYLYCFIFLIVVVYFLLGSKL